MSLPPGPYRVIRRASGEYVGDIESIVAADETIIVTGSDDGTLNVSDEVALAITALPELIRACRLANRYLADLTTKSHAKGGIVEIERWREAQGTLHEALELAII